MISLISSLTSELERLDKIVTRSHLPSTILS